MGIRQRKTEEDNILSGLHTCTHRNVHIHTCILRKEEKKGKSLGELLTEKGFDIIQMCLFNSDQL